MGLKFLFLFGILISYGYSAVVDIEDPCIRDRQFLGAGGHRFLTLGGEIKDTKTPAKVLSIDGGGVRGIIPAVILAEIERQTQRRIYDLFDVFAGTSTGGIISLGVNNKTNPLSAESMVEAYKDLSLAIFPSSLINATTGWAYGYKYSEKPLEGELRRLLGDQKLSDLLKPTVVTSVDGNDRLSFFRSYRAWDPEKNFLLRDVGRATSAAPTYFKHAHLDRTCLVDGGLGANNPSIVALIEAYSLFGTRPIQLVSLGTGRPPRDHTCRGWKTYIGQGFSVIDSLFNTQAQATEDNIGALTRLNPGLNLTYHRAQPTLHPTLMALDNPHNTLALERAAREYLEHDGAKIIKEIVSTLLS